MATVIRMQRNGRTHKPFYRIVVQDSRIRTRGRELDTLGVYQPCARPEPVSQVDARKTLEWLRKGAQPSETARNVLSKLGIMKHFHDGTTPEETTLEVKGGVVEDKGYNAPPPKAEAESPASESEAAPAEAGAAENEG
jgi:small subunit ribosomal protein S16